jgi:hypothetical protein
MRAIRCQKKVNLMQINCAKSSASVSQLEIICLPLMLMSFSLTLIAANVEQSLFCCCHPHWKGVGIEVNSRARQEKRRRNLIMTLLGDVFCHPGLGRPNPAPVALAPIADSYQNQAIGTFLVASRSILITTRFSR